MILLCIPIGKIGFPSFVDNTFRNSKLFIYACICKNFSKREIVNDMINELTKLELWLNGLETWTDVLEINEVVNFSFTIRAHRTHVLYVQE